MKIIQLRSAGDFSCALRELRLLLLSPPASAGGELAYKDTFPPAEVEKIPGGRPAKSEKRRAGLCTAQH